VKSLRSLFIPKNLRNINEKNFLNVEIDAVGIGLSSTAGVFLPIFLARLGGGSYEIGLLTSMPAITGFLLSIPLGRFLQNRKKIVPIFSAARLTVVSCYFFTGLSVFLVPVEHLIPVILAIWAFATIPQTIVAITFTVIMNIVAGPSGRFELMSRRWSILGIVSTLSVFSIGQLLDHVKQFPSNYQFAFLLLSLGGLISYYFSSHIDIPDIIPQVIQPGNSARQFFKNFFSPIFNEKPFISYNIKRFVYQTGLTLAAPLLPVYFVHEIKAPDSWIATINMAQTTLLIIGYLFWTQQSRSHGTRRVIIWATLGLSFYPLLISQTHDLLLITALAGMAGIFQAGLDLVFFDEMMRTVPVDFSATFVSFAQSAIYLSNIMAPMAGSYFATQFGIGNALVFSALIRFFGFVLFWLGNRN
jgi:hypothetical protein